MRAVTAPKRKSFTNDVIVVGAGPAGTEVARYLAARGVDVLLLEKAVPPRHKPCGGGFTGRTIALLGETPPSGLLEDRLKNTMRDQFDRWLVERAGSAGPAVKTGAADWPGNTTMPWDSSWSSLLSPIPRALPGGHGDRLRDLRVGLRLGVSKE